MIFSIKDVFENWIWCEFKAASITEAINLFYLFCDNVNIPYHEEYHMQLIYRSEKIERTVIVEKMFYFEL